MANRVFLLLCLCVPVLSSAFVQAEPLPQIAQSGSTAPCNGVRDSVLKVAVFGLGGQAQILLTECLKLKEETGRLIRIVAICDNHAKESLDSFTNKIVPPQLRDEYIQMFEGGSIYQDTEEGIETLFREHPWLDRIFISSTNNRHVAHLNAALRHPQCQSVYLEKPLFMTLAEFNAFHQPLDHATIHVGLTLRYAPITKLVEENLKKHKQSLGKLRKVDAWEHVNFGHGLTIIMMNWRRYQDISGGLLLDKSVHDLDLALYFMGIAGVHPAAMSISTVAQHNFYKKSNKSEILRRLLTDEEVRKNAENWDLIPWQRTIDFEYDQAGKIDWKRTMDSFFHDFPENDDFSSSNIIPDNHLLTSKILTESGDVVDFCLDLRLDGFSMKSRRGCRLCFDNGEVDVDIVNNKMVLKIQDQAPVEMEVNVEGARHSGGDVYIAHTLLGSLPSGNLSARFSDPSVQISTLMGLVSEYQALHGLKQDMWITHIGNRWVLDPCSILPTPQP